MEYPNSRPGEDLVTRETKLYKYELHCNIPY